MAQGKLIDLQAGFSGGWVPRTNPGAPDDSYRYAKNVRLVEGSAFRVRQGTRRLLASAHPQFIKTVMAWRTSSTAASTILFTDQLGDLYTCSWASATSLNAPVNRGGGFPTTLHNSSASFRDGTTECLYIADSGIQKWDGAALTVPAGMPSVSRIFVANNRLFGFSVGSDTLYWSGIGNGDTLGDVANGGGFATVRAYGSSTGIISGFALGATIVLVHDAGVSFFRGNTSDDIDINAGLFGVASGIGAVYGSTPAIFDTYAQIFTRSGVYVVTESGLSPLFDKDHPDILLNLNGGSLDGSAPPVNVHAFPNHSQREIWWVTSSSIAPTGCFAWHMDYKRWMAEYTMSNLPTSACTAFNSRGLPLLLMGGLDGQIRATGFDEHSPANIVYQDNVDTAGANGTDIACQVKCRRFWTGATFAEKTFGSAMTVASLNGNTTVAVTATKPDGTTGGALTLAQPSAISGDVLLNYRSPLGVTGPFADLTVGWTQNNNNPVTIAAIVVDATNLGERGA